MTNNTEEPVSQEPAVAIESPSPSEELKEWKDKYLRLLAETENTRKRLTREKQESIRFAVDNAIAEFLPPLDNLENALKFAENMSAEVRLWATGFQMILGQFKEGLSNNGATPFSSEGEIFDSYKHQAVEIEETDAHPEGTIVQEFVRGWKNGDRIIRHARVKIAKPLKKLSEEQTNDSTTK